MMRQVKKRTGNHNHRYVLSFSLLSFSLFSLLSFSFIKSHLILERERERGERRKNKRERRTGNHRYEKFAHLNIVVFHVWKKERNQFSQHFFSISLFLSLSVSISLSLPLRIPVLMTTF